MSGRSRQGTARSGDAHRRPDPADYRRGIPSRRRISSKSATPGSWPRPDPTISARFIPLAAFGYPGYPLVILLILDGVRFGAVSEPGLGNRDVLSFRMMVEFRGKLFVAKTGSVSGDVLDRNFSKTGSVSVSDDPVSGKWQLATPASFGDPSNRAIFGVAVFDDLLYAGTGNPEKGFQVWKTSADGDPPYQWEPVIIDGAFRCNLNEFAVSMAVFNGALYVGSGLPGLGYDKAHDVGPGAAELIRIRPDGSWDLVVGTPRFTRDGLKIPISAGAQLWATEDGETWEAVTMDGLGNAYAVGIRTLLSTPDGLFVETSNHQEVEKLWRRRSNKSGSAWIGGLEVWLGTAR